MSSNSKAWIRLAKLAFGVHFLLPVICDCVDVSVVLASVGQTAVLPCHNVIQGNVHVVWKDKDLTTLTLNDNVLTDDRRFSVQHKYQNDWDLEISGVRLSDTGNYTCCFVITSDCQTLKIFSLVIQVPPTIVSVLNDVTISTGGNTTLVCDATGVPKPTIKWLFYRSNAGVKELNATGVYSIIGAQPTDAGRYECVANNGVLPAAYRSLQVIVTFKPHVTIPYREVRQEFNSDTLLECHIRSNPIGELYWEKNGRRLDNEPDRYRLNSWKGSDETETLFGLIVYKLRSGDFARYTCIAKNQFGTASESVLISIWHNGTLRMLSSPRDTIAQTGQNVLIDCTVEGMTKDDQLTWERQESRNGRYIKLFDSTNGGQWSANVNTTRKYRIVGQYNLAIESVAMDDAGLYRCHVNGIGNFTANLAVVVSDPSIGCSSSAAQTNGHSAVITVVVVVCLVAVFIIIFVVVVFIIVRRYQKQLNERREHSTTAKTEGLSSIRPTSSYH